jgi:hypothetical protein
MADNLMEHLEEHACLELLKEHHLGSSGLRSAGRRTAGDHAGELANAG